MFRNQPINQAPSHDMQHYNHEQEQELAWQKSQLYSAPPSGLLSPPLENGEQHPMSYAQSEYLPAEQYFSQPVYYTPSGPHPVSPPMYQIPALSNGSEGREYQHQSEETHLPSPTDTFFPPQQQQQHQQTRASSMTDSSLNVGHFSVAC